MFLRPEKCCQMKVKQWSVYSVSLPVTVLTGVTITIYSCDLIIKVLFVETYANVVFVIRCLYSAVSLTLVRE